MFTEWILLATMWCVKQPLICAMSVNNTIRTGYPNFAHPRAVIVFDDEKDSVLDCQSLPVFPSRETLTDARM
ncbi:hypothetical protein F4820DRAFT_420321 [Hypoxylon rubiginosum]|uniref:Uncharacterized protein n=1 Tax=Hypoxylon rubiginosum TaxID=110542 RepID=A0ACB9Z0Y0_9PEZI|nr:hypothetical protein F4820DRAFT_420321 [Hypoxylon rubiginosum]